MFIRNRAETVNTSINTDGYDPRIVILAFPAPGATPRPRADVLKHLTTRTAPTNRIAELKP
jgi:hypothetical protein